MGYNSIGNMAMLADHAATKEDLKVAVSELREEISRLDLEIQKVRAELFK